MKLPSFRRLFSSDFPSQFKQLIDTLSVSLNNGIEVLYEALDNRITLRENISCTVNDVTVIVDATGKPTQTVSMKLNTTNKVDGCIVISVTNQTTSGAFPPGAPFVTFAQSSAMLNFTNFNGLAAGQTYVLRIVAFQQ